MRRRRNTLENVREEAEQAAFDTASEIRRLVNQQKFNAICSAQDFDTKTAYSTLGYQSVAVSSHYESPHRFTKSPSRKKHRSIDTQKKMYNTPMQGQGRKDKDDEMYQSPSKSIAKKSKNPYWLCCCCGTAFDDEENASIHEEFCVQTTFEIERTTSAISVNKNQHGFVPSTGAIEIPHHLSLMVFMRDESLFAAVTAASKYALEQKEVEAEQHLLLMAKNKAYYQFMDTLSTNNSKKKKKTTSILKSVSKGCVERLQHAHTLIKEKEQKENNAFTTQRTVNGPKDHVFDSNTLYINLVVKQSVQLITHKLERLAKNRWEQVEKYDSGNGKDGVVFRWIKKEAQEGLLKLFKMSMKQDFAPSVAATNLATYLFHIGPKQLKRMFGTEISACIVSRDGAYFVLSVNVLSIDWSELMKHFYHIVRKKQAMRKNQATNDGKESSGTVFDSISLFGAMEIVFAFLYQLYWPISVTFCTIVYRTWLRSTINRFILTAMTDSLFNYMEEKGVEMDLEVVEGKKQAAFSYTILRQIEKDKGKVVEETAEEIVLRGNLLGQKVALDSEDIGPRQVEFEAPKSLETVVLQIDLPIGYRALRRALLQHQDFMTKAIFEDGLHYKDISHEPWDKFDGYIGNVEIKEDIHESDFVGAKRKCQYLMPASTFAKANMAYEEIELKAYNNYFFTLLKEIRNPDVPYGKTFITLSQITIVNIGQNRCHMECSVEAKFPNGPPFVQGQIRSAMRAGTQQTSVIISENIERYVNLMT